MARPLLLIVISSLFSGACSLICHHCIPDGTGAPCTDSQIDCPSGLFLIFVCGSQRIVSYSGGKMQVNTSMRSCMRPQLCSPESVNMGQMKLVINSECCLTDNCNTQDVPATTGGANGKECYTCNGANCTVKMKCEGVEDHCISANLTAGDQNTTMKGCASKSVCSWDHSQLLNSGMIDMECCQGDMCNGVGGSGRTVPEIKSSTPITIARTAGGGVAEIKSCAAITIALSAVISLLFH